MDAIFENSAFIWPFAGDTARFSIRTRSVRGAVCIMCAAHLGVGNVFAPGKMGTRVWSRVDSPR